MSKSYTVNGDNMFSKCLSKASTERASVVMEFNNIPLYKMLYYIASVNNTNELVVIYNISGGPNISQREKIELLSRLFISDINKFGITEELFIGYSNLINNLKFIKILVNTGYDKSIQIAYFNYPNSREYRLITCDTFNKSNEIATVVQYLPGESIENNLISYLVNKSKSSGRNCVNDIINIIDSELSLNRHSPCDAFIKVLFNINRHHINSNIEQNSLLSSIGKSELQFQTDGVNSLISILLKYNMAYLADSVGLGKTIIALRLLAKTGYNALIITPTEAVKHQWESYIENTDIFIDNNIDIYYCLNSYQSLNNFNNLDRDFDIVIFDEAHNFRNMNTLRYKRAQELCAGRKVLLLGATPVNNGISDIEAQLFLGLDYNKSYDFGVGSLSEFFSDLRKSYSKSKKDITVYKQAQKDAGAKVRQLILSKLMVRRTHRDIEKYYKSDIDSGKLHFPEIRKPISISYKYSGIKLARTLDILSGYNFNLKLTYALYNPSRYLKTGESRDLNMVGLTKVRLIKLLDSSIEAFIKSIRNMISDIEDRVNYLLGYIDNIYIPLEPGEINNTGDSDVADEINTRNLDKQAYLRDLYNDKAVLLEILSYWTIDLYSDNYIEGDVKSSELCKILDNHHGEKIIIFTEFIATARSLYEKLYKLGYRVIEADGSNKINIFSIVNNFSICDTMRNDYDILITTNILSEGVNLNRASVAINYDITWNPMVITQRIGRLNRIDSIVRQISIYNFFPCDEMDSAILSESNIISKYALASYSVGLDDNYLSDNNSDIDVSLMEYKKSIFNNTQSIDFEEELDFKTVDFRYAPLALELVDVEKIPDCGIIASVESDDIEPGVYGVLSNNGRVVACSLIESRFSYLDYNQALDIFNSAKCLDTISDININTISRMINHFRKDLNIDRLGSNQLHLISTIDKLLYNLDNLYNNQELDDIKYAKILNTLNIIKSNILNGLINDYLCKIYHSDFINNIKNNVQDISQYAILFDMLPQRFKESHPEYLKLNKVKILSILLVKGV